MEIAVIGAGSIGCFVGGMLAGDNAVTLVGRPGVLDPVAADGLTLEAPGRPTRHVPAVDLRLSGSPEAARSADAGLLCVKSGDTTSATTAVARYLRPDGLLVSLQNGLHNPTRAQAALDAAGRPDVHVLAGMVSYNVVRIGPATYRRATSGEIMLGADPAGAALVDAIGRAGLGVTARPDMREVQHAKLLLNLNNAVNALSGIPLRDELADRDFRRVLAGCQAEGLAVFRSEGVTPARLTPISPAATVRLLRAPDPLFRTLARASLQVDPAARSSMADDLRAGRPTEVDELQGEVSRLGRLHGIPTPVCDAVVRLVGEALAAGPDALPHWRGPALAEAVGVSRG